MNKSQIHSHIEKNRDTRRRINAEVVFWPTFPVPLKSFHITGTIAGAAGWIAVVEACSLTVEDTEIVAQRSSVGLLSNLIVNTPDGQSMSNKTDGTSAPYRSLSNGCTNFGRRIVFRGGCHKGGKEDGEEDS